MEKVKKKKKTKPFPFLPPAKQSLEQLTLQTVKSVQTKLTNAVTGRQAQPNPPEHCMLDLSCKSKWNLTCSLFIFLSKNLL